MKLKRFKLILSVAVIMLLCAAVKPLAAKADEVTLVGLSDDLIRLFMSPSDELEVIDASFVETNDENKTELLTINGTTQLASQFVFTKCNSNSHVNVRKGPSTDTEVVGWLLSGSISTAIGTEGEWTHIISGDIEGYAFTEYLEFGQEAIKKADEYYEKHCRVISSKLKIYSKASTSSTDLATPPVYSDLEVIGNSDKSDWIQVKWKADASTITGYVKTSYISSKYSFAITKKEADEYNINKSSLLENIVWPYPRIKRVCSDFGWRQAPGEAKGVVGFHSGLDIGGTMGDPVIAALTGTVSTNWGGKCDPIEGWYVHISCKSGGKTVLLIYDHLSKVLVKNGQVVSQSETVGLVGSTGNSTGPHLHFGMRVNGKKVDPAKYLSKRYSISYKMKCLYKDPDNKPKVSVDSLVVYSK